MSVLMVNKEKTCYRTAATPNKIEALKSKGFEVVTDPEKTEGKAKKGKPEKTEGKPSVEIDV